MITTNSFPNTATSAPSEEIKQNSLSKEDLEGNKIYKTSSINKNINGGDCQEIVLK